MRVRLSKIQQGILAILAFVLVAVPSTATSTLVFSGGGYEILVVVSDSSPEEIVTVYFGGPMQTEPIVLTPHQLSTGSVDCDRQKLALIVKSTGDKSDLPAFRLRAHHKTARLYIAGSTIQLTCDWSR